MSPKRTTWFRGTPIAAVLGAIGVLLGLGVVAHFSDLSRARRDLGSQVDCVRQAGEPLEMAELKPQLDLGDAARSEWFLSLLSKILRPDSGLAEAIDRGDAASVVDDPRVRQWLREHAAAVDRIEHALLQGPMHIPVDHSIPVPLMIDVSVHGYHDASRLFAARSYVYLDTGNRDAAFDSVFVGLLLSDALHGNPYPPTQTSRFRCGHRALDALEYLIANHSLSDSQRRTLDGLLADVGDRCRLTPALVWTRAAYFASMKAVGTRDFGDLLETTTDPGNPQLAMAFPYAKNWWWGSAVYRPRLLREQAFQLEAFSRIIDVVDAAGPDECKRFAAVHDELSAEAATYAITSHLWYDLSDLRNLMLDFRQRLQGARVALRVAEYRRRQGRYPANLSEILDAELPSLPLGTFSREPIHYKYGMDGFELFDVDGAHADRGVFRCQELHRQPLPSPDGGHVRE